MSKPPPLRPLFNEKSSLAPKIPFEKKNLPKKSFLLKIRDHLRWWSRKKAIFSKFEPDYLADNDGK